jgi:hypothetical protein
VFSAFLFHLSDSPCFQLSDLPYIFSFPVPFLWFLMPFLSVFRI